MGDGCAVAGSCQAQVLQGGADLAGQARRVLGVQARCQQAELSTTIARGQPGVTFRLLSQALEQLANGADQRIGALATQSLVQAGQVVDPQHQ
ncbi:hypothetical protein D3C85_619990 [compost metagenome]